ncbi:MAG: metal-dependent hydrolase [Myxococcales bacterium]
MGWLLFAPVFLDLLWGVFIVTGIEQARIVPGITEAMPLDLQYTGVSHSFVMSIVWGLLVGAGYLALHRGAFRIAVVLFLGVVSHFVLDWISHGPDMPLVPHGPRFGLGLWNYPVTALSVELVLFAVGMSLYLRSTSPRGRGSVIALAVLSAFLVAVNVGAYFGPPPPGVEAMAATNLLLLVVLWIGARIDRSRDALPRFDPQPVRS